ncbi:hypothetical protein CLAFUW4_07945 [Fulvia fulva]|uniref:Uncharacterized protein n=1 Tax=Passalora fulva TaxID=5499 RepID=A0A9Q8P684_PASFU|nr:uncharacterized protein CLAFUR5_08068 [Fulvia fulva]KAK4628845.1 hypothetical protein CLAFUR4_07950 [Fulvia fulva]KAK4630584.1 hypothetical protein CLAFUR0_07947 [Fulvia fulva]UJO14729.1 hypothetical protein CLAFUR5_08068 [Fulvia fulva]WPV12875.1 hypothetical protein CLAFUW4_07945 [Fulvia fulva]WPV27773.1 hypothetical protein CLAFUW7_07946 [Fulvia fulva]
MFGFLRQRRGAFATGGILGGITSIASGIYYFMPNSASTAAVEVATTALSSIISLPTDIFIAHSAADQGVCYPLNGTVHGCHIGYSQCEVPSDFYTTAFAFDPFLVVLALVVYCTCLHGAVRLRNALLTPKSYATICATVEHLRNGVSVSTTVAGIVTLVVEHTGATMPPLPEYAGAIMWLFGTAVFSLLSAYLASGKVSEVDKARSKLQWIITKKNKTIAVLITAIKDWESRYESLAKLHENNKAELGMTSLELSALVVKFNEVDIEYEQLVVEQQEIRAESKGKDVKITELEKDVANKKAEHDAELDELQRKLRAMENERDAQAAEVKRLNDKLETEEAKNAALTTENGELRSKVASHDITIDKQSKTNNRLMAQLAGQSSVIKNLEADLSTSNAKSVKQINALQAESFCKDGIIRKQLEDQEEQTEEFEGRLEAADAVNTQQSTQIKTLEGGIASKNAIISKQCSDNTKQSETISNLNKKLESATTSFEKEKSEWSTKDTQQQSKIASLTLDSTNAKEELTTCADELVQAKAEVVRLGKACIDLASHNNDMLMVAGFEADANLVVAHEDCLDFQCLSAELQGRLDEKIEAASKISLSAVTEIVDVEPVQEQVAQLSTPSCSFGATPIEKVGAPSNSSTQSATTGVQEEAAHAFIPHDDSKVATPSSGSLAVDAVPPPSSAASWPGLRQALINVGTVPFMGAENSSTPSGSPSGDQSQISPTTHHDSSTKPSHVSEYRSPCRHNSGIDADAETQKPALPSNSLKHSTDVVPLTQNSTVASHETTIDDCEARIASEGAASTTAPLTFNELHSNQPDLLQATQPVAPIERSNSQSSTSRFIFETPTKEWFAPSISANPGPVPAPQIQQDSGSSQGSNKRLQPYAARLSRYRPERGIASTSKHWEGMPDAQGNLLKFGPDGKPSEERHFPKVPRVSSGADSCKTKSSRKSATSQESTDSAYVNRIVHNSTAFKQLDDNSTSASSTASKTAIKSPVLAINFSTSTQPLFKFGAPQEPLSPRRSAPNASDTTGSSYEKNSVSRSPPNTSATSTTPTETEIVPPVAPACYYKPHGNCKCKNWIRGTCVGDPNNYDPITHEWIKVVEGEIKRYGQTDSKEDRAEKTRAKTQKTCSECWVHKRGQQAVEAKDDSSSEVEQSERS